MTQAGSNKSISIRFDTQQRDILKNRAQMLGLPVATMLYQMIQQVAGLPPKQDGRRKETA